MGIIFNLYGFPMVFSPADDDGGSGGGSGGDDDGNSDDNDDDGGSDDDKGSGDDDGDKKGLIDKKDVMGDDDKKGDDEGDKDKDKKTDDDKKADRPEFIPEKFWDKEKAEPRLEAMAKAYGDLENKLSKTNKAPDEYKIELSDDAKKLFNEDAVDDDPILAWFTDYAKENNFTQDMFNQALNGFSEKAGELLAQTQPPEIDPKAEKEKLGKNHEAIIDNQVEFLGGMFKRGEVNEEQMQEMLILTETAAGINALQAIRAHYGEKQNIPMNLTPSDGVKSADELRKMQADEKYGNDPEYTATVDAEYEKKYGKGTSGESQKSAL